VEIFGNPRYQQTLDQTLDVYRLFRLMRAFFAGRPFGLESLCKQGVWGSNPHISTNEIRVASLELEFCNGADGALVQ
jgi:hypothetical protein